MLPLGTAPAWVLPAARFDLDFANGRYYGGGVSIGASTSNAELMGTLVAGNGTGINGFAPDSNGLIYSFGQYTPMVTPGCGLWAQGNYTNYCLWCRDQTNAVWTKTSMTAAKDQPGSTTSGSANSASSLLATGANATSLQAITVASHIFVGSAYVKRLIGTGTVSMTIDGGTTYTDITSLINSTTYTQVTVPSQTLANPSIGFKLGTSGDKIAVDFCQCENNGYATTPLSTTNATVARGTDEPHIGATTGQAQGDGYRLLREIMANGGPWSMRWEVSGNTPVANIMSTDAQLSCGVGSNGGVANFLAITGIGTVSSANSGTFGLGNVNKATYRVNGNGEDICLNGGAIAHANGSAFMYQNNGLTHMGIGNIGSGLTPLDGYIKRLTFWNQEITDGQMIEFTR